MFRKLTPFLCLLFRIRLVQGQNNYAAPCEMPGDFQAQPAGFIPARTAWRATALLRRVVSPWRKLFQLPDEHGLMVSASGFTARSLRQEVEQTWVPNLAAQPRQNGNLQVFGPRKFFTTARRFIVEKKISAACFVTCFVIPASLVQAAASPATPAAETQRTTQAGDSKPEKPAKSTQDKKAKGKKAENTKRKPSTQEKDFDKTLMGIYG